MIPETWAVRVTPEFQAWLESLELRRREVVDRGVQLLKARGAHLGPPFTKKLHSSRYPHMRELRLQDRGRPIRVLYAFDPTRAAVLLVGGDKTGDDRFYERVIPIADRLYDQHMSRLQREDP